MEPTKHQARVKCPGAYNYTTYMNIQDTSIISKVEATKKCSEDLNTAFLYSEDKDISKLI